MSTRSSFLLLGFFSRSAYAAECTADDLSELTSQFDSFQECTLEAEENSVEEYCADESCKNKILMLSNSEYPDCTSAADGQQVDAVLGPRVDELLFVYNNACNTTMERSVVTSESGNMEESTEDNNSPASTGAHAYSAAHYMIAMLVPMALLCL